MIETEIDKKKIESLLPHREPMLLIDKLTNIVLVIAISITSSQNFFTIFQAPV